MAGILGRVWGALKGNQSSGSQGASELLWLGPASQASPVWADASDPQAYAINTWVYACVNEITSAVASANFVVDERKGKEWEEAPECELAVLLEYVNAHEDQFTFKEELAGWLTLHGNAFIRYLHGGSSRKPIGLQTLPPYDVTILPGKGRRSGYIRGYEFRDANGYKHTFDDDEICHIKLFGSTDPAFGQSPIKVLERVINTYSASDQFTYAFYRGGGFPTVVLVSDQKLDPRQVEEIQGRYAEWQGQSGVKTKPFVTGAGVRLEVPGVSPDGVTAHDLPVRLREEICAVLRVPPALVGIYEYANYANSREQRRIFYSGPVSQYWRRIEGAMNSQLIPAFGADKYRIRMDTGHIAALQPDFAEVSQAAATMIAAGTHTVDEVREKLFGDPPIGGDWGTARWGSMTQVVIADASGKAVGVPEPSTPPKPETPKPEAPAPEPEKAKTAPKPRTKQRRLSETARVALWKAFNANRDAATDTLTRLVQGWYDELTSDVLARLEANKSLIASRVKAPQLDALMFLQDWGEKKLRDRITPALAKIMLETGQQAVDLLAIGVNFSLENPRVRELLAERTQQMKTVVETAQGTCRASLQEALKNGETIEDMRKRVIEWSATGKDYHAVNVARTETGVCSNAAALEGYKQGGATGKEWLSVIDKRSRPEHAAMDGTIVPIDGLFNVDGTKCYGPGDAALGAAGVCQCRCTIAPVLEEDMPTDGEQAPAQPPPIEIPLPTGGATEPVPIGYIDV